MNVIDLIEINCKDYILNILRDFSDLKGYGRGF